MPTVKRVFAALNASKQVPLFLKLCYVIAGKMAVHPLLSKPKVTLRDVAKEPYIQLTIDEAAKTTLSYWSKHNLTPDVVFLTDSVEAVRSLVATGAGVTILSDMVYRPWSLEGDKLESRELSAQIPTMDVGLAWSRSAELPAPARAFIEFCRMEFLSGNPRSMTL